MLGVKIRARVKVEGKNSFSETGGGSVKMVAVYSPDESSENKVFTDFIPELVVFLNINKQDTFDFYQQDKEYYVDFIPVEESK